MYAHGDNIRQKELHHTKYGDAQARQFIAEIRPIYDSWRENNEALVGPKVARTTSDSYIIGQRTRLLNQYKDFVDQQSYAETFDSRSNLHSTVLEEFMYYLFRDLVSDFSDQALIGRSHAFKDIFFKPTSYTDMLSKPNSMIERKDHDFAIGIRVDMSMSCQGSSQVERDVWDLPAVAIECKTYLDKTMLQDASTAAEQLRYRNPNAIYIVVAEWLKLTEAVNLKKFKIDQIYVLRKQKNTDREYRFLPGYVKNPIYEDVLCHLFERVRDFLCNPWEGGVNYGLQKGYLLQ